MNLSFQTIALVPMCDFKGNLYSGKCVKSAVLPRLTIVHKILNETFGKVRISNNNKQGIDKNVKEMMKEKRKTRRRTKEVKDHEKKGS